MKRIVTPVLVIVAAATAFWFSDRWLPVPPGQTHYLGYIEGETILIAAPQAGRIVMVKAVKGAGVKAGDVLFSLDPAVAEAELARAEAAVRTAEAVRANLETGKRTEELAVIWAQKQEAEAALAMAEKELHRASVLTTSGTSAQQRLDQAEMQVDTLKARIRQLEASEAVAMLPARPFEIEAATSRIDETKAQVDQARQRLADLMPLAPLDAEVENTYFDAGEWVAAGQPVVALLPPLGVTLRFFVPEQDVAAAAPGTRVNFACDGCPNGLAATITRVAREPEHTPPVIYSQGARAKLVFLVEARPNQPGGFLRPGLPIEVEPLQ